MDIQRLRTHGYYHGDVAGVKIIGVSAEDCSEGCHAMCLLCFHPKKDSVFFDDMNFFLKGDLHGLAREYQGSYMSY